MSGRGLGRYLAPLALLACAAAVLLTVRGTLQEEPASTTTRPAAEQSAGEERRTTTQRRTTGRRTYTVRQGDTLSQIAEETGVSVEQLIELNENLDPRALNAGDRLRLRR
jgi:LysM repeat protein